MGDDNTGMVAPIPKISALDPAIVQRQKDLEKRIYDTAIYSRGVRIPLKYSGVGVLKSLQHENPNLSDDTLVTKTRSIFIGRFREEEAGRQENVAKLRDYCAEGAGLVSLIPFFVFTDKVILPNLSHADLSEIARESRLAELMGRDPRTPAALALGFSTLSFGAVLSITIAVGIGASVLFGLAVGNSILDAEIATSAGENTKIENLPSIWPFISPRNIPASL